jgi:hypothetical protein
MMLNLIDAIGIFENPIAQLLVILGIAGIVDGVRPTSAGVPPDASDQSC